MMNETAKVYLGEQVEQDQATEDCLCRGLCLHPSHMLGSKETNAEEKGREEKSGGGFFSTFIVFFKRGMPLLIKMNYSKF